MSKERNFQCPKCTHSFIDVKYRSWSNKLICHCGRCLFEWEEEPSDIKSKDERYNGILYDPMYA